MTELIIKLISILYKENENFAMKIKLMHKWHHTITPPEKGRKNGKKKEAGKAKKVGNQRLSLFLGGGDDG